MTTRLLRLRPRVEDFMKLIESINLGAGIQKHIERSITVEKPATTSSARLRRRFRDSPARAVAWWVLTHLAD